MDRNISSLPFQFLDDVQYNVAEKALAISLPICILGFIGNSIILWILCCRLRIKLNLYFVCVAAANNIMAFSIIAEYIMFFNPDTFSWMYHKILDILHLSSHIASFYIFAVIAVERWCIHFFPVWYKQSRPLNFSAIVSFSLWGLTSLTSVIVHYLCSPVLEVHFKEVQTCTTSTVTLIITQSIFIPCMIFFPLGIWIRIHMKQKEVPPQRFDVTIVATVLFYLMLIAPFKLATILMYWFRNINGPMLGSLHTLLESIISTISPFIYLIVGSWKKPKVETAYAFLELALTDKTPLLVKTQTQTLKNQQLYA
ncbi:mas-related G-protein coupled receptor member H-like [Erythrolamprus reginae]|uniref:mas-related G-protein coupled receptor member H-like n=1 Tax=Erythrolamprus reginae TaxID=121349 RepID=UPI00396C93A4